MARCTVERLMRRLGLRGVMRGKVVRTTIGDTQGAVPAGPSQPAVPGRAAEPAVGLGLHVRLDLARLGVRGLRHRRLRAAHRRLARQQLDADRLRARRAGAGAVRAPARARQQPGPSLAIAASQYVSIRYSERLAEAGIEPSVGSKGDSYDNALAETINGLYKAELIHRRGALEDQGGRRTRHAGMGVLVQPPPPARTHRLHPAGGARGKLLPATRQSATSA